MHCLKPVNEYDLGVLQKWLLRPGGGNEFLKDMEGDPWDDENKNDLVSVYSGQELDAFTGWIADKFVPWLHQVALHRWKVSINDEPIAVRR